MEEEWRKCLVNASDHSEHVHWAMHNGGFITEQLLGPSLDMEKPSDEGGD